MTGQEAEEPLLAGSARAGDTITTRWGGPSRAHGRTSSLQLHQLNSASAHFRKASRTIRPNLLAEAFAATRPGSTTTDRAPPTLRISKRAHLTLVAAILSILALFHVATHPPEQLHLGQLRHWRGWGSENATSPLASLANTADAAPYASAELAGASQSSPVTDNEELVAEDVAPAHDNPAVVTEPEVDTGGSIAAGRALLYAHAGPLRILDAFALILARYAHPHATIALLRHYDVPEPSTQHPHPRGSTRIKVQDTHDADWRKLLRGLGVQVRWYDQRDETDIHREIFDHYVHSSSNPVVYERFCMLRFASLRHYMMTEGIDHAFMLDLDVITFENLFEHFAAEKAPWTLFSVSSWFVSWTSAAAADFASFIAKFYHAPSADDLLDNFSKLDTTRIDGKEKVQFSPELWEMWPEDEPFKQVSDMILLDLFTREATETPFTFLGRDRADIIPLANGRNLQDELGIEDMCSDETTFSRIYHWNATLPEGRPGHLVSHHGDDLVGIHLQGPSCKTQVLRFYRRKFRDWQRERAGEGARCGEPMKGCTGRKEVS